MNNVKLDQSTLVSLAKAFLASDAIMDGDTITISVSRRQPIEEISVTLFVDGQPGGRS